MTAIDLPDWATTDALLVLAAILLGLGFLAGQWRLGRLRGANEALELQARELEVRDVAIKRLENEVARYSAEVNMLRGTVGQLREENRELRELLMGEKVQPALWEAMLTVARTTAAELREKLEEDVAAVMRTYDERFDRVEKGIVRLLTAPDEENGPKGG